MLHLEFEGPYLSLDEDQWKWNIQNYLKLKGKVVFIWFPSWFFNPLIYIFFAIFSFSYLSFEIWNFEAKNLSTNFFLNWTLNTNQSLILRPFTTSLSQRDRTWLGETAAQTKGDGESGAAQTRPGGEVAGNTRQHGINWLQSFEW